MLPASAAGCDHGVGDVEHADELDLPLDDGLLLRGLRDVIGMHRARDDAARVSLLSENDVELEDLILGLMSPELTRQRSVLNWRIRRPRRIEELFRIGRLRRKETRQRQ